MSNHALVRPTVSVLVSEQLIMFHQSIKTLLTHPVSMAISMLSLPPPPPPPPLTRCWRARSGRSTLPRNHCITTKQSNLLADMTKKKPKAISQPPFSLYLKIQRIKFRRRQRRHWFTIKRHVRYTTYLSGKDSLLNFFIVLLSSPKVSIEGRIVLMKWFFIDCHDLHIFNG